MKVKSIFLLVVLSVYTGLIVKAQSYDKLWREVKSMQEKDRPKSALEITQAIYQKALHERNAPQMMKAYLASMDYRRSITPDSILIDIEGLQKWAGDTSDPVDAAVLHSLVGSVCLDYLNQLPYNLRYATATVTGDTGGSSWTGNELVKKIFDNFRLSLKDPELLLKKSADEFRPLVIKGETSDYFRHDLLNLLGRQAVESLANLTWTAKNFYSQTKLNEAADLLPLAQVMTDSVFFASSYDCVAEILRIYQTMLQRYQSENNQPALLLTLLDRAQYIINTENNQNNAGTANTSSHFTMENSPYYRYLKNLSSEFASSPVCAEVYNVMADFALSKDQPAEALFIVREAIRKYPDYNRINKLKETESIILQPRLTGNFPETSYPGKLFPLKISYCNLTGFSLYIYKVNLPSVSDKLNQAESESFRSNYAKLWKKEHFDLLPVKDYRDTDTLLQIETPAEGIWLLELVPDIKTEKKSNGLMYVTKLQALDRGLPGNLTQFVVVDSESGHPVSQAEVILYKYKDGKRNQVRILQTDSKGTVTCESGDWFNFYKVQYGTDQAMAPVNKGYGRYYFPAPPVRTTRMDLFTDRRIYRPGQTVYMSGIAYTQDKDSTNVNVGKEYAIRLLDANGKIIAEKKLKTNDFGSFSGEFALPASSLPGSFRLETAGASTWFRVEEYKRPTFNVVFEPVKQTYQAGDSICITGIAKTFSGIPVQEGTVNYTVTLNPLYIWRMQAAQTIIASGTARTDNKGTFQVCFYLESSSEARTNPYYHVNYKINATVTDVAGESQEGILNLPYGNTSLILSTDLKDEIQKDAPDSLTIFARNLANQPITVKGVLKVCPLLTGKNAAKTGDCVLNTPFVSNRSFGWPAIRQLPSGKYRFIASAQDEQGKEVKTEKDFILYSLEDHKPPVNTVCWFKVIEKEFGPGKTAKLVFGSSDKDVYVLYDVFSGKQHLESKQLMLTDSVVKMEYPYKETYGDGILVTFAFIKNGQFYQQQASLTKTEPDKHLVMKWETFRNKLRPGQQEEWKLSITYPDGKAADAELLATLYDASLDQLAKNNWFFNVSFERLLPSVYWNRSFSSSSYLYATFLMKKWNYPALNYDKLIVRFLPQVEELMAMEDGGDPRKYKMNMAVSGVHARGVLAEANTMYEANFVTLQEEPATAGTQSAITENAAQVQIRSNFAETAFFYPQLRTDAKGNVSFSFILPESLTQWKFMGLSHTKTVDWAKLEATATASKDFMLSPNMPRFVRVGDLTSIAANVINFTGKPVAGTVRMELFDPETEKVFISQKQKFKVEAGQTQGVNFTFTVNEMHTLMACRMVAEGSYFSDGEQQFIPVLSNKQPITESLPLVINGKGTRQFSLKDLFNHDSKTATDRRLTLEFTGNPAWYAVQALPTLSNPVTDNTVSWAASYYSNTAASYMARSNPRIQSVFDAWKRQGGTQETLWSNLQKNQELKNILLDESPWLAEAVNEADQKQRIGLLFDLNNLSNRLSAAADKLKDLQRPDGAWSWYKGMPGNRYITQFVVEAFGRLAMLTGQPLDAEVAQMQDKAFAYLHKQALEEYERLKKEEKAGAKNLYPSALTLQYLYICALTDAAIPAANKEANAWFITRVAASNQTQTIYEKAMSAVILEKAGKKEAAEEFIISLKEYAVETPDMGMYYDTPKANYSWTVYKIPTQVAAIEAMQYVAKDKKAVEEMKIWLLRQKQTQAWDTPMATVNALYALLYRGTDLLKNSGEVKIKIGNHTVETISPDGNNVAGLGYVKESWSGKKITPSMQTVTIEKQDAGIAWGAVYAQYLEQTDQVSSAGGVLQVDKNMYVERMEDNHRQLVPLTEGTLLRAGDKVVSRLTIRCDRDMDFIQLKDERAACMEPVGALSGYRWNNGIGYYEAIKDASTEFFFDGLRKGTYILDNTMYVARSGIYASGIATLQSAYAPEYSAHTASQKIKVSE